jgi:hypothetical protein
MRFFILSILMGGLYILTGCTSSILGTVLAPESVVSGAVTGVAETGAETLSGASLNELADSGSTVAELDRILMENPNAVNSDRLQNLRDQLNTTSTSDNNSSQISGVSKNKKFIRNNEKPLPYGKGDYFRVKTPENKGKNNRLSSRPDTIPMGYSLYEEFQPVHFMKFNVIRLQ